MKKLDGNGATRIIVVMCAVLMGCSIFGEVDGPFTNWDLDSFCGFKAFESPKKGVDENKTVKLRKPFRKFKDVSLEYGPYYLRGGGDGEKPEKCLRALQVYKIIDGKSNDAVRKEFDECCRELARLGVVFSSLENDGNKIYRHGVARYYPSKGCDKVASYVDFSAADINISAANQDSVKRGRTLICINIRWEKFAAMLSGYVGSFQMNTAEAKTHSGIKSVIETLIEHKFGTEIPSDILEILNDNQKMRTKAGIAKNSEDEHWVYWRRLSKPFLGMQIVKWSHSPSTKRLNVVRMENNDTEWQSWANVKENFNKLRNLFMKTFNVQLDKPKEIGRSIVSVIEKDGFRVKVGAEQNELPDDKSNNVPLPSRLYIEFSVDGIQ